jgi:hypothetical protein
MDIDSKYEDYKVPLTNREKQKMPGMGVYCGCDKAIIWEGMKCPVCGAKSGPKAKMKPGKFKYD